MTNLSISKLLIKEKATITDSLKQLGKTGLRCLIVVDEQKSYLGTITDGDLRREILKNKNFKKNIKSIYNRKSTFFTTNNFNISSAKKIIEKKSLTLIPIINKKFKVVDYYNIFSKPSLDKEKNLVIIMAGGQGKRLQPFTSILPKPLIPIKGKPVIVHIMNLFKGKGLNNFVISINKKNNVLKSYLQELKTIYEFDFIEEKKALGTAGALKKIKKTKKPFFLVNCDNIFKINPLDLLNFHNENNNFLTLVASIKNYEIPYGVCTLDKRNRFLEMQEKPNQSVLANTGFYICDPRILKILPKKNNFGMNELIDLIKKKKKKIGIFPIKDLEWQDTGNWFDYMKIIQKK